MKVLLINNLYDPHILGGAERSVQFLAEALAKNGDVPVVVSTNPNLGVREDYLNGVKIYYVAVKNLYSPFKKREKFNPLQPFWHVIDTYNPLMAREIRGILDMEAPDVVHTNNLAGFSVAVWPEIKRREIPLIHTLRDYYLLCPRSTMFNRRKNCASQCWYCMVYSFLRKRMSNFVNAVVGISRFILNRHLDLGYFSRAQTRKVIFSAYPASMILSPKSFKNCLPLRLGFLGRLKQNKGIELLLQVVAKLSSEKYELWIGGKGPERQERYLKNRYAAENINFLGFVEPESFFNNIDILIVPSLWNEPLGRIIFEAYAYGVPVIGSNRGGIPEIIDVGKTGFLFDPDQPDTLLSLLKRIKQTPDLLNRLRKNALTKSREFLPERSLAKYIDVYRTIMCKKAR